MNDLERSRAEIDAIDEKITHLFERRMELAEQIAAYKKQHGLPTLNEKREEQVLERVKGHLKNASLAPYLQRLYRCLMEESRNRQNSLHQQPIVVGYQGVEGSFSHEASLKYTAQRPSELKGYESFPDLCRGLLNDETDCIVIPVENSTTGAVVDVYDLLMQYPFYVVGEVLVRANHHLLAMPGATIADITEVYSHPQAFMQCKEFLSNYSWKQIPYQNTAISAKFVAQTKNPSMAAIAGTAAAKLYGLSVLAANINYNVNNITKFIVLSRTPAKCETHNKTSVILSLKNEPGTLFTIMEQFQRQGVNMLKIESRPEPGNPFHYVFFIDFEGNPQQEEIQVLLTRLEQNSKSFRFFGSCVAEEIT